MPATITVNTHVDTNGYVQNDDISLHEAIRLANGTLSFNQLSPNERLLVNGMPAANQADSIQFNLGNANNAIALTGSLPSITDRVTIDGFTQQGAAPNTAAFGLPRNAVYRIEIDGTNAGIFVNAFTITGGSNTVIRGLSIVNFSRAAIEITANNNIVEDNSIGINRAGQIGSNGGPATVIISGAENVVRNSLVSGNNEVVSSGVWITGATARLNRLEGNYIGTDFRGETAVPNSNCGIVIDRGATENIIGGSYSLGLGNLISGNIGGGVVIAGTPIQPTANNQVQGNLIGTDRTGTAALANGAGGGGEFNSRHGVFILDSSNNQIGGAVGSLGNVISGNNQDGIKIERSIDLENAVANGNQIQGNYIGTDYTGLQTLANGRYGIFLNGAGSQQSPSVVGGTVTIKGSAPGNIVSGNGNYGIYILGQETAGTHNRIQGNLIGVDALGNLARGNGGGGVLLENTSNNLVGGLQPNMGNVISGNNSLQFGTGAGVFIKLGETNSVQNNFIGTNLAGTAQIRNFGNGVTIRESENNWIGTPGAGNLISGNQGSLPEGNGVHIFAGQHNWVQANLIGTNVTGNAMIGNANNGVSIENQSTGNVIGGINLGEENIIGGNQGYGVSIIGTAGNLVDGNFIGRNAAGDPLPNRRGGRDDGILLPQLNPNKWGTLRQNIMAFNTEGGLELWGQNALVSNNVIESNGGFGITIFGGSGSQLTGNTIRSNQGPGIAVVAGQGHNLSSNSIYSNSGLGIDLGNNGVTLNDAGDADAGPNNLQNYPVLTSVVAAGGQTYVQGSIDSTTSASAYPITIRFYSNAAPDPSGYGEGEMVLGSITMTGPGPFTTYLPAANFIAATATDALGNTSEFSPCYAVSPDLPPRLATSSGWTPTATASRMGVKPDWAASSSSSSMSPVSSSPAPSPMGPASTSSPASPPAAITWCSRSRPVTRSHSRTRAAISRTAMSTPPASLPCSRSAADRSRTIWMRG